MALSPKLFAGAHFFRLDFQAVIFNVQKMYLADIAYSGIGRYLCITFSPKRGFKRNGAVVQTARPGWFKYQPATHESYFLPKKLER